MPQLFELVVIAFLLFIAVELLLIYREIMRAQIRGQPGREEAAGKSGQTINVTVGGAQGSPAASVSEQELPSARKGSPDALPAADEDSDGPGPREIPAPVSAAPAPMRSTASGLLAKKCHSCGMENSTYRTECFNCGTSL